MPCESIFHVASIELVSAAFPNELKDYITRTAMQCDVGSPADFQLPSGP